MFASVGSGLSSANCAEAAASAFAASLIGIDYIDDVRVIHSAQTGEASGTLPEMLMRYTAGETEEINSFYEQMADWLPRLLYAVVACYIIYGLLFGGGVMPRVAPG